MSIESPFKYIQEFSKKNNLSHQVETLLSYNYNEEFEAAIASYLANNSYSDAIRDTVNATLLNEDNLKRKVIVAKSEISDLEKNIEMHIEKKYSRNDFLKNILIGIISNFIWTLILIGLLLAAGFQVGDIVNKMDENNSTTSIESNK